MFALPIVTVRVIVVVVAVYAAGVACVARQEDALQSARGGFNAQRRTPVVTGVVVAVGIDER
jgi:hypothetical protein